MTNSQSSLKTPNADASGNNNNKRRRLVPRIPYKRPEKKPLGKDEYQSFKCCMSPLVANSATYEITIPYFSTGTVEEYIKIKRKLSKVIDGLNATTGPHKYILARSIFHGTAATTFLSLIHI